MKAAQRARPTTFAFAVGAGQCIQERGAHHERPHPDVTVVRPELLDLEVGDRAGMAHVALADSNWLAFAVACRWMSSLTYVPNGAGRPRDLMWLVMEGFDSDASNIQLAAMTEGNLNDALYHRPFTVKRLEPKVRFGYVPWAQFEATEAFDVICLARSPEYTPPESDTLLDAIRERFIEEVPEPPM